MKMPALALLVCLLSATSAGAQIERPQGFADMLWRTKLSEVKKRMAEKGGKLTEDKTDHLTYEGGTFAGKATVCWGFDFVSGELYRGAVILKTISDPDKEFDAVKAMLTEKYGRPTTTSKKGGNVKIIWRFEPDFRNRDKEYLELSNKLGHWDMKITYRNESMNTAKPEEGF
jgi:hypothetical protein